MQVKDKTALVNDLTSIAKRAIDQVPFPTHPPGVIAVRDEHSVYYLPDNVGRDYVRVVQRVLKKQATWRQRFLDETIVRALGSVVATAHRERAGAKRVARLLDAAVAEFDTYARGGSKTLAR